MEKLKIAMREMSELIEFVSTYETIPIGNLNNHSLNKEIVSMVWHDRAKGVRFSVSCKGVGRWFYEYSDERTGVDRYSSVEIGKLLPKYMMQELMQMDLGGGHRWD